MTFEWDDNKEQINIKKHGIDFKQQAMFLTDTMWISMTKSTPILRTDI